MTTISVNGLRAVSAKLFHPWTGAWVAEVDFDLEVPTAPTGPCVLKIGDAILMGAVDKDASGRFGEKARARIIGGSGGWHRNVSARHFHNDAGVLSSAVIAATAAEVGEKATDVLPTLHGVDYSRSAGPASRVLAGRDWYVDTTTGTTIVGPRPLIPATPLVDVLEWNPKERRAELASDALILPGTILVDPRFGTATVRDVEQTFSEGKARANVWCGTSGASRLAAMFGALVREHGRTVYLKPHHYRVVSQGVDGRLTLQAVKKSAGVPDSIALPVWLGVPGVSATVVPGTEAIVVFIDGDPSQPAVVSFKGEAIQVKVGAGSSPVARSAEILAWAANVTAALGTLGQVVAPLSPTVASTKLLTD